ncbi:MAG: hypothetical protein O7C98_16405, partial [Planctomycetota bacterium]|nr:hypothetical protein [Planctomycetota bacterium]
AMRKTVLAGLALFLLFLPANAQQPDPVSKYLELARTAMEAQIKAGDALLAMGDTQGALRAYEKAVAIFRDASKRERRWRPAPAGPEAVPGDPFSGPVPEVSKDQNQAVQLGLRWLAAHQDVDAAGNWDCDGFTKHDPPDDLSRGPGSAHYDVGVTGLATLAFLGAGYTDRGTKRDNPYARNVRMALRYLTTIQDEEGCFGPRASQHYMYNHALATLALCEAWAQTRNPRYKRPAQDGLNFLAKARNPYMAWRYGVRLGDNDTSVTTWAVLALRSGKYGGLDVDPDAFEGARAWIDKMTDPDYGKVGYLMPGGSSARPEALVDKFPADRTESMTAAGILVRLATGETPESAIVRKGADLCLKMPPVWNPDAGTIDMYYWLHGTLAMYQVGGEHWRRWVAFLLKAALEHQHPKNSGSRTGSWDPVGPWGPDGGRVYATAVMTMALEIAFRYDKSLAMGKPGGARLIDVDELEDTAGEDDSSPRRRRR